MKDYPLICGGNVRFDIVETKNVCVVNSELSCFPKTTFNVHLSFEQIEEYMDLCKISCDDGAIRYLVHDAIMFFAYKTYYEETSIVLNKIRHLVKN